MAKDLTTCKPTSGLIKFAVPMILGNVFQQLYNLIDAIIVGNYVGPNALAAVGASSIIILLFTCVSIGGSIGSSVVISQLFGARRMGEMMTTIKTVIITFFCAGAVLMLIGVFLSRAILELLKTPFDVIDDAALYMRIYFYGFLFTMMFNVFNSVFNATGDSKKPLIFLGISSVLNVGLNIYFVARLGMGVAGVAWATFISQGVAVTVTLIVLIIKLKGMNITEPSRLFDTKLLKTVCRVAVPSSIQQSIVAIGLVCLQSIINDFGSVSLAGFTAAAKIDNLAIIPMSNMGNAVATFTAQNIGAKKLERVPKGLKAGFLTVVGIGLCIALLLFIFGPALISLFVSGEGSDKVIEAGTSFLRISSAFYFMFGSMNCFAGILRGSGDMKSFLICYAINFGARLIFAFTVAAGRGLYLVAWATVIGWTCGFIFALLRYRTGKWKTQKLI